MTIVKIDNERREHARFGLETTVWLVSDLDESRILAQTENLSRKGVTLLSNEKISLAEMYHLMFFLPDDTCIMCEGRVEWVTHASDGWKAGVKFDNIATRFVEPLEKYLEQSA